jgi:hypothetical protein
VSPHAAHTLLTRREQPPRKNHNPVLLKSLSRHSIDTLKLDATITDQDLREMLQGNDSITELDLSAKDRRFGLGGCPRLTFMTLKTVAELSSLTSLTLCRSVSVRTLPSPPRAWG